jgi:hypothetical protein
MPDAELGQRAKNLLDELAQTPRFAGSAEESKARGLCRLELERAGFDCKKVLHASMEQELVPIRSRAKEIAANPKKMKADLEAGAEHARAVAGKTMREVKEKMGLA